MSTNCTEILIGSDSKKIYEKPHPNSNLFFQAFSNLAFNEYFYSNQILANQSGSTTATSLQLKPIQTQTEGTPNLQAKSQSRVVPPSNPAHTSAIRAEKSKHSVETVASLVDIPILTLGKQLLNFTLKSFLFSTCFNYGNLELST